MDTGREASAKAPTAGTGIRILDDLRATYVAGGPHEAPADRLRRLFTMMEERRDEVTTTLSLMLERVDPIGHYMNLALLGMRYDPDTERDEEGRAEPLHRRIELQSLRMKCPQCEKNQCGRKGKFHDVVYKTSQKGGTGSERNMITAMGGTVENNVLCEVDPETGRFYLSPIEARKALRQWGEFAVNPKRRWVDRQNRKGDRWKIREVAHYERYAFAVLQDTKPDAADVPAMTAD